MQPDSINLINKYFSDLSFQQQEQFKALQELYADWNLKINVVSRKDIDQLYLRHVLHSLGIAEIIQFEANAKILDVGTGGGFPGIPLAILFPEAHFTLVDSIGKKIKVVKEVAEGLHLKNVQVIHTRVESIPKKFDYIISRAVAHMDTFTHWTKGRLISKSMYKKTGIYYLKGGDLTDELKNFKKAQIFELSKYFDEAFFENKKVVYIPG